MKNRKQIMLAQASKKIASQNKRIFRIFPLSKKITIPEYNAVSQSETEKFFFVDVKNNFSMSCVDKSRTCVCHILKIVNFKNFHT